MRIVHACLRYPPAIGGVETYVQRLVQHTRDIAVGRDVRVLTSKMQTHSPITELDPETLLDDPLYVQRLHHASTPFISYPRLQALNYYLGHHAPDVVHGYSFWYQPADVAARFSRRRGLPFIFHPMYYTNRIRQKNVWQLYRRTIGRATFTAADAVVVISPYEQQLIEQHRFPVKRFILIPPGIDSEELSAPHDNPFTKRSIIGRIILVVSRLAHGKGIDEAIGAMPQLLRRHSDVQLAIAGPDFGQLQTLKQYTAARQLSQRVHFLGRLDRAELIGAYQHAAVLVHPSHYEAFGIAVAESLAAGTPVVARNTAALSYVAPDQQAALLFNTNHEMIDHLETMLIDSALARRLTDEGRRRVQQEFTWPAAREKMLRLYEELK